MKDPTIVAPQKKRSGRDSSRLVILCNLNTPGAEKVLCTIEEHQHGLIARLPGGEAQKNESDIECVHRERREETGLLQEDFDTPLFKGYMRPKNGRKYRLHVFYCGVSREIAISTLKSKDPKIQGHIWLPLHRPNKMRSTNSIQLQPSHVEVLEELERKRPEYLRELESCITVQEKIRSTL